MAFRWLYGVLLGAFVTIVLRFTVFANTTSEEANLRGYFLGAIAVLFIIGTGLFFLLTRK